MGDFITHYLDCCHATDYIVVIFFIVLAYGVAELLAYLCYVSLLAMFPC